MKIDKLKQYVSLREQLLRDKAELESRLAEINKALGAVSSSTPAAPASAPAVKRGRKPAAAAAAAPVAKAAKAGAGKRAKNTVSLREAVLAATKAKPLARQEILTAVQAAGYKFAAKDPLNSLSTLLYTDKGIKNYGGKFGPA
jgi:hypothetical protein